MSDNHTYLTNLIRYNLWWTICHPGCGINGLLEGTDRFEELTCIGAWTPGEVRSAMFAGLEHVDGDSVTDEWSSDHPDMPTSGEGSNDYIHQWEELSDEEYYQLSEAHNSAKWGVIGSLPWEDSPQIIEDLFRSGDWCNDGPQAWMSFDFKSAEMVKDREPTPHEVKDQADRDGVHSGLKEALAS